VPWPSEKIPNRDWAATRQIQSRSDPFEPFDRANHAEPPQDTLPKSWHANATVSLFGAAFMTVSNKEIKKSSWHSPDNCNGSQVAKPNH
jgi:hypothetical protein